MLLFIDVLKCAVMYCCAVMYFCAVMCRPAMYCCAALCVPYHGDVVSAKLSAADLHKSPNADDYIYDCDHVIRNNIVGYISDDDET